MSARTVITGAGGWVGRVAASSWPRDSSLLVARTPRRTVIDGIERDLASPESLGMLSSGSVSTVIHAGFPTQDHVERMGMAAYLADVEALRAQMRSALGRLGPTDVIYLSSGAATSVEQELDLAPRTRTYGAAKLEDEQAFRELTATQGGRLCIVRAFALSGPYMTKPESYALGNMIFQAARSGSVEVRAAHPVRRSYMAIEDMLGIATHAVGQMEAGETVSFETAGEVLEMGELAARVLGVMGCDPSAVVRPEFDPDAPPDDYLGDPEVVGRLAPAAGVVPASLDDQIAVTADWLRSEYRL